MDTISQFIDVMKKWISNFRVNCPFKMVTSRGYSDTKAPKSPKL